MAKSWGKLEVIIIGTLIALLGVVGGVMGYTSKDSFCAKCHEIKPYVTSKEQFSHKKVPCLDCHADPGITGHVLRKIKSPREVISHYSGNYNPKNLGVNLNQQNCINCHNGTVKFPKAVNVFSKQDTSRFKISHIVHQKEKITCLDCHRRIVHGNNPLNPRVNTTKTNHMNTSCAKCHDVEVTGTDPTQWKFEASCTFCHKTDLRGEVNKQKE